MSLQFELEVRSSARAPANGQSFKATTTCINNLELFARPRLIVWTSSCNGSWQCQWFRELASIPFQNFLVVMLDAIRKFVCFLEFPLWAFLNSVHHKDRHAWMISRNQQCNCFRSDLLPTSESIIKYLSTTHSTSCHFLWATDERTWTIFCAVAVRLIFESYGSSKLPVDLYSFRSCSWH